MKLAAPALKDISEYRRQLRNLIATIRAIVRRTADSADSVAGYVAHLGDRLEVLARVQEILMREPGALIDLQELLADEFLRQGIPPRNLEVTSQSLLVDPAVAAVLALALHELATNAVKFGRLEEPSRKIHVRWTSSARGENWSTLEWRESPMQGGYPGARDDGFGFELIRKTLPYEIGAESSIELTAQGVVCDIAFPRRGHE